VDNKLMIEKRWRTIQLWNKVWVLQ